MSAFGTLIGGGAMMLAVLATAGGLARGSRFFRRELAATGQRELALDGLRGWAALLVATHHAALSRTGLATGNWGDAQSSLLQLFAPAGVIIFFMLTGCLFWGKARAAGGKIPAVKLWRGRFFRIAPLYWFSLLLVLLVAISDVGGDSFSLKQWAAWLRVLALGALGWHNFASVNLGDYNAGVVWTLWYEWSFYLALPFIAWLAVGRKIFFVALLAWVLTFFTLWRDLNLQPGLFFILGMVCPALLADETLRERLRRPGIAAVALAATLLLGVGFQNYLFTKVPSLSLAGALFPTFIVAAAGNNFFGLLTHPAIRCLGTISFSFYLLHGIVFRLLFRILKTGGWTNLPPWSYWLILAATAVAATFLCAVTYRWIEFPFLSARKETRAFRAPPAF